MAAEGLERTARGEIIGPILKEKAQTRATDLETLLTSMYGRRGRLNQLKNGQTFLRHTARGGGLTVGIIR